MTEVVSRGKHLLVRTSGGLTVHTHLKMDGFWRVQAVRPDVHPVESFNLRLVLANAQWKAAGYLLGVTEVIPTADEDRVVGHLGPDLLGPDWDPALAVRLLRATPTGRSARPCSTSATWPGIGNVYAAELLFLRGIEPWRPVGSIGDLPALVDLGHRLLDANKARPGHVTTGDTRRGREHWVYGRAGKPCRWCGTGIKEASRAPAGEERVRFWCPNGQL